MAQCVQTPTATTTEVSTSESLFPTSSLLTSTLPGSVSTSIFRTCTQTNSSVACEPTLTSVLVTLPGNTTVVTVSATGTSDIPITNIITLFGSSCSTSPSTTPSSTPTTTPSSTPPDTSSTPSVTPSSPPPTTSSTVTSDGSTFVDFSTLSSSQTPVPTQSDTANLSPSTPLSTSSTDAQTTGTPDNLNGNHSAKKSSNAGPIAGGVIGGIAALALLGFLTWRFIKKQPRFDDIFNKDPGPHYKKRNNGTSEPKPYTYGLVGQNPAMNPIGTPPSSPPPIQQAVGLEGGQAIGPQSQQPSTSNSVGPYQSSGNEIGQQPSSTGNDVGRVPNQPPLQHLRNPSLTPLLAGVGAAAAAGGAGAALTASNTRPNSSRPSSSASSQLMGPLVTPAQTQGYVPNSTYPPALQNWTNAQGYVPASTSPTLTNTQGYAPGPSMEVGQSTGLSPNASVNSTGTMPSTYSQGGTSWQHSSSAGGSGVASGSGGAGAVYNPVQPGVLPLLAAAGLLRNSNSHQQHPEDPFGRSGSPVSFQEQRILRVTNDEPSSPASLASREIYDPNLYYSGQVEASSSSSTSAAAPFGSAPSSGGVDGKGRPLNLRGEKAPLIHLDGALYQVPAPEALEPRNSAVTPAPPAYQE